MLEKSLIDIDKKERKMKQKTLTAQIVLPITILVILLSVLSLKAGDYLCNCYCPTSRNYVGYDIYTSGSTTSNAQTVQILVVVRF
jgi:hypothetical protein